MAGNYGNAVMLKVEFSLWRSHWLLGRQIPHCFLSLCVEFNTSHVAPYLAMVHTLWTDKLKQLNFSPFFVSNIV